MNPQSGPDTASGYTYAGVISELESLGVVFERSLSPNQISQTPYGIKLLAMYDHEMLHRIMDAIRDTDVSARIIWAKTLGTIALSDVTTRRKSAITTELARLMPQYERMLAINPIDAAIMIASDSGTFWSLNRATHIEKQTGIAPGDPNYKLVQANLIHVNITQPKKYDAEDVQSYLQDNHDDIAYIAEHIDGTIKLFTELHRQQDASRGNIETMLNISPALAEGAL